MSDPLAALRTRFVARAADDLATLRTLSAVDDGPQMQALTHRLAGTAGTFGFAEVSRLAGRVDEALHEGRAPPPETYAALLAALAAITSPA